RDGLLYRFLDEQIATGRDATAGASGDALIACGVVGLHEVFPGVGPVFLEHLGEHAGVDFLLHARGRGVLSDLGRELVELLLERLGLGVAARQLGLPPLGADLSTLLQQLARSPAGPVLVGLAGW